MIGPEGEVDIVRDDAGIWREVGEVGKDTGFSQSVGKSGIEITGDQTTNLSAEIREENVAIGRVFSKARDSSFACNADDFGVSRRVGLFERPNVSGDIVGENVFSGEFGNVVSAIDNTSGD